MNNQILRQVALTRLAVAQSRKLEIEAQFAAEKSQKLVLLETEIATLTDYVRQLETELKQSEPRSWLKEQSGDLGFDREQAAQQLQESREKVAELRRLLNSIV